MKTNISNTKININKAIKFIVKFDGKVSTKARYIAELLSQDVFDASPCVVKGGSKFHRGMQKCKLSQDLFGTLSRVGKLHCRGSYTPRRACGDYIARRYNKWGRENVIIRSDFRSLIPISPYNST